MWTAVAGAAVVAGATMARVYRGGRTLNDHAVAVAVAGCIAVWPVLWIGAVEAGAASEPLAVALAAGAVLEYALFHVLDGRSDPGPAIWAARLAQPAYAFSLWAGLLLLVRAPWAAATGTPLLWPGPLLALPLGLALWGSAWTWLGARTNRHAVPVPGLPREVRVVHLSDLHASPTMRRAELDALVARCNVLEPDVVVVTGDLLMPFSEEDHDFLLDALAGLRAPAFACPGNHDLPVLDRLAAGLGRVGVRMLVDEAAVVRVGDAAVEIVGATFHWRDALARLGAALDRLPPAPGAHARVLLAHDPRLFHGIPAGRFDLVLSGHTHGGQVGTDMLGIGWSVLRPLGVLDQGWWRRGATLLYVHRGNWVSGLPPRMGIAPEIAVHTLSQAGTAPAARAVP